MLIYLLTPLGDCNEFYLLVERIDIINKKKKGQKSENQLWTEKRCFHTGEKECKKCLETVQTWHPGQEIKVILTKETES